MFPVFGMTYAHIQNLDIARMKVCITNLRPFMVEGGWMPLAGTVHQQLYRSIALTFIFRCRLCLPFRDSSFLSL